MDHIAELAVAAIPHCDACSVSSVEDGRFKTTVSSDRLAERVAEHEYRTNDARWTSFTALAAKEGVQSCYSVPLLLRSLTLGALNLYSLGSPFDEHDERVGPIFAAQAVVTLANAGAYRHIKDAVDNLNLALESRDLIGQAKVIIMERGHCSSDLASAILRSISQSRNIKLRDLAEETVTKASSENPR